MGYLEIFLTGIALAMDAFAVSICKGIKMPKLRKSHIVIIAVFFGGFQMLMPLIGWCSEVSSFSTYPSLIIGSHSRFSRL